MSLALEKYHTLHEMQLIYSYIFVVILMLILLYGLFTGFLTSPIADRIIRLCYKYR